MWQETKRYKFKVISWQMLSSFFLAFRLEKVYFIQMNGTHKRH